MIYYHIFYIDVSFHMMYILVYLPCFATLWPTLGAVGDEPDPTESEVEAIQEDKEAYHEWSVDYIVSTSQGMHMRAFTPSSDISFCRSFVGLVVAIVIKIPLFCTSV